MANDNGFVLLTGTANLKLAQDVAKILGKNVDETVSVFADGEKRIVIPENLRKRDVFIIQPTCPPVDANIISCPSFFSPEANIFMLTSAPPNPNG